MFCFHVALQTKKRKKVTHANAPDEEVQRHTGDRKSRNWTKALTSEHSAFMLILNNESLYNLCKLQTCSSEMLCYYFSYLSFYLVIQESCYINFITLYKTQGPYFQMKDGRHMESNLIKQCFNANVCHLSIYISVVRLSVLIPVFLNKCGNFPLVPWNSATDEVIVLPVIGWYEYLFVTKLSPAGCKWRESKEEYL